MKKAEKMFMAINNVDERLIDEAKGSNEKPVLIRVEKHLPVKEIIAFAACFTVLAAGIFAAMRFRMNGAEPADSGTQISSPVIQTDTELQAILSELKPSDDIFDWFFNGVSGTGELRFYFGKDDSQGEIYHYMPVGRAPGGSIDYPQSYSEMEELIYKYFTDFSAEVFMKYVCHGTMTARPDGSYLVSVEDKHRAENNKNPLFIEADEKMYCRYWGIDELGKSLFNMAKITSQNDNAISFTYPYQDKYGNLHDKDGVIEYERDGWRLYQYMPLLDMDSYSINYSKLQVILKDLAPAETIANWFLMGNSGTGKIHKFLFPGSDTVHEYWQGVSAPDSKHKAPQTIDELKELMLEYFTQDSVDDYMKRVRKGTVMKASDGRDFVVFDVVEAPDKSPTDYPPFIEIDGNLYFWNAPQKQIGTPLYETADNIFERDDTIRFTYDRSYGDTVYNYVGGDLKFERGGWKVAARHTAWHSPNKINADIISDIGLTYSQLAEKRGELVANTHDGVLFKNGIGIYGWRSEKNGGFNGDGGLPNAGGCNIISEVKSFELLTNFMFPISIDNLCKLYGFIPVSDQTETELLDGYSASFKHRLYNNVTFTVNTGCTYGYIDEGSSWQITLNTDCIDAVPVI